jgi:hypothetical protein
MLSSYAVEAASGDLWVDPVVAIESHRAIDSWLTALRDMDTRTVDLGRTEGFPAIGSAQQLARKFEEKATGSDGLQARIRQFGEAAQQLSDLFAYSIKKFRDTDEAAADYLKSKGL